MLSKNHKLNNRKSYMKHAEARREYGRRYYAKNKEKMLGRMAAYRAANKERVAAGHKKSHAKWYAKNKAKVTLKSRTRLYGISSDEVAELLRKPCSICGRATILSHRS